jgi:tetratricopeptide (TPR) repeat protein
MNTTRLAVTFSAALACLAPAALAQNATSARQKAEEGQKWAYQNVPEKAVAAYDECIANNRDSNDPETRQWVATAYVEKIKALLKLDKPVEAFAACEEGIAHFKQDGKFDDIIALCDEVLKHHPDDDPEPIQDPLYNLMLNKGIALMMANRAPDALKALDALADRYNKNLPKNPRAAECAASAYVLKARLVLREANWHAEALLALSACLQRFKNTPMPTHISVAQAHTLMVEILDEMRQWDEALEVSRECFER